MMYKKQCRLIRQDEEREDVEDGRRKMNDQDKSGGLVIGELHLNQSRGDQSIDTFSRDPVSRDGTAGDNTSRDGSEIELTEHPMPSSLMQTFKR